MMLLRRHYMVLVLAVGLLSAVLLLNGHLVPAGDNATYMVLGQALVTGRGYRMISDPRLPAMALYPPGYPLLLAGVLALTGTARNLLAAIVPLKLLSLAMHLGSVVLTYGIFRRRNNILAALTALLVAVNPHVLHFATEVGTEVPYLFLSLCCLWLFERYWRERRTSVLAWVVALAAATFYVRSIALVMAAAFVLHQVLHRRFQQALFVLLVVAILAAPWFIYSSLLPTTGTSVGLGRGYFALYFSNDPYGTTRASLSDWVTRLVQNVRIYALNIWPDALFPHSLSASLLLGLSPAGAAGAVLAGMITILLLLGFLVEVRRKSAVEWYVAVFFASCVGYLWAQSRLIVPIIPFAIYYLLTAVDMVLRRVWRDRERVRRYALAMVGAALALSSLAVNARHIRRNLDFGLGHPVAAYYSDNAEWSNYLQAMDWIATEGVRTRPSGAGRPTIVMCRKADLLYVLTGNQALEYPYSSDGMVLKNAVDGDHVAYMIEDAFTWTHTTEQYLRPALQSWLATEPTAVSLAFETNAPCTRVWRVDKLQ